MKIEWIAPSYSTVKMDALQTLLNQRQQVALDRSAPLDIALQIGSYSQHLDTSGLATFYKAVRGFIGGIANGDRAILIINDDDAFHVSCEKRDGAYLCSLRLAGEDLAQSEEGAVELEAMANDYLAAYELYLREAGLSGIARL